MKIIYNIRDIVPYINWVYFYYAWGVHTQSEEEKSKLRYEAEKALEKIDGKYQCFTLFKIFDAYSDGDDVIICMANDKKVVLPFLRQQQPHLDFLCLSDFISPEDIPLTSKIGIFATSVSHGLETDFDADPYEKMMMQLLADRLAEATAERMHEEVRKKYWGYAPDENLTMADLHMERFQGIRPAVGYPSLPDTSFNFLIDSVLDMKDIGIRLTESGAMKPHASVSGLMISHPKARYFTIGKIGEDQLTDYSRRRGLPVEVCRKFLAANL
ncbi:MAG: 5-methyltetrahydrofolate--homocysteine methyltransferase [Prevotella sp.]|nr:5-methyltetrahydrofolate--homocysteine methyltransferase [Prevotella sp.]